MCFTMQWQFRPKRRQFLQCLGSVWALGGASATIANADAVPAYRYTGRLAADGSDFIDVFRVVGRQQTLVQKIPSAAPVSLTLHPNRQFLYAANSISFYDGLPRGTVEIFSIEQANRCTDAIAAPRTVDVRDRATQPCGHAGWTTPHRCDLWRGRL